MPTLKIFVITKWSENPVAYATVTIGDYDYETDENGYVEINIPTGNYSVSATAPEHEKVEQTLSFVSPTRIVLMLKPIFRAF